MSSPPQTPIEAATAKRAQLLTLLAFSPRAASVIAEAHRLARSLDADLTLLHVGEESSDTRRKIGEALRLAGLDETCCSVLVRTGRVDEVACQVARDAKVDLIVAGALEKEGSLQYFVGSVARRVARNAPCSVLLLTEPNVQPRAFGTIVAAVHFDDTSKAMMRFAVDLARHEQAHSLHVVREYEVFGLRIAMTDAANATAARETQQRTEAEERIQIANFVSDFDVRGMEVKLAGLQGREGWEAVQYARRQHADLLVLPAPPRRLTFWDKFFQHGVEYALQTLPCALLLYRPRISSSSPAE